MALFVREFECPSCGGTIQRENPASRSISCPYCGQTSHINADSLDAVGAQHLLIDYGSMFSVGMTATVKGHRFRVLGRRARRARWQQPQPLVGAQSEGERNGRAWLGQWLRARHVLRLQLRCECHWLESDARTEGARGAKQARRAREGSAVSKRLSS